MIKRKSAIRKSRDDHIHLHLIAKQANERERATVRKKERDNDIYRCDRFHFHKNIFY